MASTITAEKAKAYVKKLLKHYPFTYCPTLAGFTENKTPHRGDIPLFYRNGEYAHTGFVYETAGSRYKTFEGNTSGASGVIANGGGVCKKSYLISDYPGTKFFRPDYSILVDDRVFKDVDSVINAIVRVAEREVGYLEKKSNSNLYDKTANAGSNNYTKYWADLYPQYQAQPWCAIFDTWILYQAILEGNAAEAKPATVPTQKPQATAKEVKCTGYAQNGPDKGVAGIYKVTANSGLNMRHSAGNGAVMVAIPKGKEVKCYGYYSVVSGTKWLLVQITYEGVTYTGFMAATYLKKK